MQVSAELASLPKSVVVSELISSRYQDNKRPDSWDMRVSGVDCIKAEDGTTYLLYSDGQQSPPQVGSNIILREVLAVEDSPKEILYAWTLYGLAN